jgi:hypothetical protein
LLDGVSTSSQQYLGQSSWLEEGYEPPLCIAVAVNVPLRGLDGAMTGEELDVS